MEAHNISDVVIVGAGIVGASAAYFLGQRRLRVTLLDAKFPGFGASGRNGGYIWTHMRSAGAQMQLGLASRALYDEFVRELDDFTFRPSGGMIYFFEHQAQLFRELVAERKEAGLPVSLLTPAEARQLAPILPESIAGATFNPLDAHMDTRKLVEALTNAAQRDGARILPGVEAKRLVVESGVVKGVETNEGRINADTVQLAAGAWVEKLLAPLGLSLSITPERMQTVELGRTDIRFGPCIYGPLAVKVYQCVHGLPSYRDDLVTHPLERANPGVEFLEGISQRADGRVILGWPCDQPGFDDRTTVAGIAMTLAIFQEHVPALKVLPIERTWACILPATADALPILGFVDSIESLALAAGHSFGNSGGPISGKLLAQLINGETPEMDLAPFCHGRKSLKARAEGQPLRY